MDANKTNLEREDVLLLLITEAWNGLDDVANDKLITTEQLRSLLCPASWTNSQN